MAFYLDSQFTAENGINNCTIHKCQSSQNH